MRLLVCLLLLVASAPTAAAEALHHALDIRIEPAAGRIAVTDRITLPADGPRAFTLHAGLDPQLADDGRLARKAQGQGDVPVTRYEVTPPDGQRQITLRYEGRIRHRLSASGAPGSRRGTPGLIDERGVYLDPAGYWYPDFSDAPVTFDMQVTLPSGWHAVSQGRRPSPHDNTWASAHPQLGIYLVAGPFHVYARRTPWGEALVYLRGADRALAERYLEATQRYVERYSDLIGDYPYGKFALVENFWESGYGMPSFSLMGSRVLRLPFIIDTSYPHEILHNWWGNGVYVDYRQGNWAEGLTTYLADHYRAERNGEDARFRRAALQKYAEFVSGAGDRPLAAFQARHDSASQALGYGKGLMFFHMIRRRLGWQTFITALADFYGTHRFSRAGFGDLRDAFERASGQQLDAVFRQWLHRAGAPHLAIHDVTVNAEDGVHRIQGFLRQSQSGPAYQLHVPLAITLANTQEPMVSTVMMDTDEQRFDLTVPTPPVRLTVDPRFELFRRLDPAELPPSFGRVFGAPERIFVVPSKAPAAMRAAYRGLAQEWAQPGDRVVDDTELERLPPGAAVWLLGWENRLRDHITRALEDRPARFSDTEVVVDSRRFNRQTPLALAVRHPDDPALAVAWLGAADPRGVASLSRRLPHYDTFSYVVLAGRDAADVDKGQWPVTDSPLTVELVSSARSE